MELIPMPAEVAAAISQVMGGIKTLGKDHTNQHQKYDFVSTDRFLAAVNPLCAQAGLVILQDEQSAEISTAETTDQYGKTKVTSWLTARYAFMLAHKGGGIFGPLHRTVMVQANGAQAFGSAQSYALKQFMRSLFQIPTGDKDDADLQPAEELPHRGNGKGKPESDDTKRAREMYAGIAKAIGEATHPGDPALGLKVDRKDREDIAFIRKHGGDVAADRLHTLAAQKIAELTKPQEKKVA
jgi:hypothetical protein